MQFGRWQRNRLSTGLALAAVEWSGFGASTGVAKPSMDGKGTSRLSSVVSHAEVKASGMID
jgi:hypothetical protein